MRTRAWRRFQRERVIYNRKRLERLVSTSDYRVESGRLAKKKTFDCGKAKCYTCHSEKLLGISKKKYKVFY